MSQTNLRLALNVAAGLADRITAELAPVCDRIEVAGSIRRRCPTVGDIELVAIPKFSPSLLPDVPGVSLLELALVAMVGQGRLLPASANQGERLKRYFIPALYREGWDLKLEVNVSDAERWPVEFAVKTGPAEFSHRLVTPRRVRLAPGVYGLLPSHCQIKEGWQVWEGDTRLAFESEREFIEWICGEWVEPERRDKWLFV